MIDVATEIQQVEQAMPDSGADQESGEVEDDSDDVEMKEEEVKQRLNIAHIQEIGFFWGILLCTTGYKNTFMQYALIWQRVIVWLSDFVPIELILL